FDVSSWSCAMIILFWILAFLSSTGLALREMTQKRIELKDPTNSGITIPDGTLFTFFFQNNVDDYLTADHKVDFYFDKDDKNVASVGINKLNKYVYVSTQTYLDGNWTDLKGDDLWTDTLPSNKGWWRVDIIKFDSQHLNVCVLGFCFKEARKYEISLNNIKKIRIQSNLVDFNSLVFSMQIPNPQVLISPITTKQSFYDNSYHRRLEWKPILHAELPKFAVGDSIDISVWMQPYNTDWLIPRLLFVEKAVNNDWPKSINSIFEIYQEEEKNSSPLEMKSVANHVKCFDGMPKGALLHLHIERITTYAVKTRVLYHNSGSAGFTCELNVAFYEKLDKEIQIIGNDGALPLIIEHSIL
ncbi:hypothetical protein PFISCL1PPCAC_4147, partial [Pristionchus fissidentatus]